MSLVSAPVKSAAAAGAPGRPARHRRRIAPRPSRPSSVCPPYHTCWPSRWWIIPGRLTAYPAASPGRPGPGRSRTSSPAASRPAKNAGSDRAPAAAAATSRRSAARAGLSVMPRPCSRGRPGPPAGPGRLLGLGPARPAVRGPVGPGHHGQAVLGLQVAQRLADPVEVVVQAGPAAVLPGQGRHDVDVVIAVVHRDPPHPLVFLAVAGQAGAVHDLPGDPHPRPVTQLRVTVGGADHAVPDELGRRP